MDFTHPPLWILAILAVAAVMALAVWLRSRKKTSYQAEQGFGPEYGHAADERGGGTNGP
jgi:hypothetical protein